MRMSSLVQLWTLLPRIFLDDESIDTALCSSFILPSDHENYLVIVVNQTWRDSLRIAFLLRFWFDLVAKNVSILADVGCPSVNALAEPIEVLANLHCHKSKEVHSLVAGPVVPLFANVIIKNSVCEAGPCTPDHAKGFTPFILEWSVQNLTIVSLMV